MNNKLKKHLNKILKSRCTISKYYRKNPLPKIKYFRELTHYQDYIHFMNTYKFKDTYLDKIKFLFGYPMQKRNLKKLQKNLYGWTYQNRIYISDKLDKKLTERTLVHELAHCMERQELNFSEIINNDQEYKLWDELLARTAELEYLNPDRRITRSMTYNIKINELTDDYFN